MQAFLAAGHVCTVMGFEEYEPISRQIPGADRGHRIRAAGPARRRADGRRRSSKAGARKWKISMRARCGGPAIVRRKQRIAEVFEVTRRAWRGIGEIPSSGLRLREAYRRFDAESRFAVEVGHVEESSECIAGLVLQGQRKPYECPAFGTRCTPDTPLGAPMVSSEGACAAYFHFGRRKEDGDSIVSIAATGH